MRSTGGFGWLAGVALAGGLAMAANAAAAGQAAGQMRAVTAQDAARIVNLGDSITDGQTYPLLVAQALREAGQPMPHFYGAGIGGDVSAGMLQRLDRDVLVFHPTMVMLMTGVNDVGTGVTMAQFRTNLCAIAERMRTENVLLMMLTTSNLAHPGADRALGEANAVIRAVARKYMLPVAEVYDKMMAARERGEKLWEQDGCHLNFAGYRIVTRAVLDALGYPAVTVPTEQKLELLPGTLPEWKVRALGEKEAPPDTNTVAQLQVDDKWTTYRLPETAPRPGWWEDQERRRGVAMALKEAFGPAPGYLAVATRESDRDQPAFLNTGGEFHRVWLNGELIFGKGEAAKGWHPGGYRLPVQLRKGPNRIVVVTGGRFFLSITDDDQW